MSRPVAVGPAARREEQARVRLLFDEDDEDDAWASGRTTPETDPVAGVSEEPDEPGDLDEPDEAVDGAAVTEPATPAPARGGEAPVAAPGPRPTALPDRRVPPAPLPTEPRLSPAEIQARLRAGKSPRAVAKAAGTDIAWIERWLPPILAERHRVLERARGMRLERARLGRSRDPLGRAVERNLVERDVDLDDVTWAVGRRQDGRWRVSVRFPHRGRSRSATWLLDPDRDVISPASELARDLGFTRPAARDASRGRG